MTASKLSFTKGNAGVSPKRGPRFRLVFSANDEEGTSTSSATFAYVYNSEIVITADSDKATLQIMDMTGRVIYSRDHVRTVPTSGLASGVYVLRLIEGEKVRTQKIVI